MNISDIIINLEEIKYNHSSINLDSFSVNYIISLLLHPKNISLLEDSADDLNKLRNVSNNISCLRTTKCSFNEYNYFQKVMGQISMKLAMNIFNDMEYSLFEEILKFINFTIENINKMSDIIWSTAKISNIKLDLEDFIEIIPDIYSEYIPENTIYKILENTIADDIKVFMGSHRFVLVDYSKRLAIKIPRSNVNGIFDSMSEIQLYKRLKGTEIEDSISPIYEMGDYEQPIISTIAITRLYDVETPEVKTVIEKVNHYLITNMNIHIDDLHIHHGNAGEFNNAPIIIDYGSIEPYKK